MTLLYLDDDQDDLGLFLLAARSLPGISQVLTTSDPLEFFTLLDRHMESSVVFLDVNMPYSGFQVLKELRKREEYNNIPVVMHSTSSDPVSVSTSRELGATHYAVKPDSVRSLRKIIEQVIAIYNNGGYNPGFVISH
jgi:CheY-like chemotaxis protein